MRALLVAETLCLFQLWTDIYDDWYLPSTYGRIGIAFAQASLDVVMGGDVYNGGNDSMIVSSRSAVLVNIIVRVISRVAS